MDDTVPGIEERLNTGMWTVAVAISPGLLLLDEPLSALDAMTTVSAVVFLYSPDTTLASVAVLNMDDAGDTAPAATMAMLIVVTAGAVRLEHTGQSHWLQRRTQAWQR